LRDDIAARSATGRLPLKEFSSREEKELKSVAAEIRQQRRQRRKPNSDDHGFTDTWRTHQVKEPSAP
jgi:hypothetical protein